MNALIFAMLAQVAAATGVQIINKKLDGIPSLLITFLLPAIGVLFLLPLLVFFRNDAVALGRPQMLWIVAAALTWVVLPGILFITGAQTGDVRLVSLTALAFPIFVAIIERNVDARFVLGSATMAAGFMIVVVR